MSDPKQRTGDEFWAADVTIKDRRGRPRKVGPDLTAGGECKSPAAGEAAYRESTTRPLLADQAFIDVMAAVEKLMDNPTPEEGGELFDSIRERMRRLAAESALEARAALALVYRAEHGAARKKFDPDEVVRRVHDKQAKGLTQADAFLEVADDLGASDNTIRNVYQANKPRSPK